MLFNVYSKQNRYTSSSSGEIMALNYVVICKILVLIQMKILAYLVIIKIKIQTAKNDHH